MTYHLLTGDNSYSSWSLRGSLLFEQFGIPYKGHFTELYTDAFAETLQAWAPARTVPAVRTPDGGTWTDSLAIAEGLAEAHPDVAFWPKSPVARAMARSITAEMHSGFGALRGDCPMNLRLQWQGFAPSEAVLADLVRIEALWAYARDLAEGEGPWLFGHYSIADAFYAPVAARIAGYALPVSETAWAYVEAHLNDPVFRRWRAMGEARNRTIAVYDRGLPTGAWPGPEPLKAVIAEGPGENKACPYSGEPVTDFLAIDGRRFGFCNPFCRDKTLADPTAWPAFMKLYET